MKFLAYFLAASAALSGCAGLSADAGAVQYPDPSAASRMSFGEAKEIVQRTTRWLWDGGIVLEFAPERIVDHIYEADGTIRLFPGCAFESYAPYTLTERKDGLGRRKGTQIVMSATGPRAETKCDLGVWSTAEEAPRVAAALLRLKNSTRREREDWSARRRREFAQAAERYRSADPKPAMSEEVRRFKVVAEVAVREKRLSDAADAFEDGLKIAPWWADGHYNAALMLGELHYYDEAVEHMKDYLALVPDAPDARAAQDKIYEWEARAK